MDDVDRLIAIVDGWSDVVVWGGTAVEIIQALKELKQLRQRDTLARGIISDAHVAIAENMPGLEVWLDLAEEFLGVKS